jgi:hypothetical protein
MKERVINNYITIPADNQSSIISQPGKSPLDFITSPIPSHLATIIIFLFFVHASIGANHINAPLFQSLAKHVAIVTLVGNETFGIFSGSSPTFTWHGDIVQRFFEQFDFRRGRTVQVVSQRNTLAVDHHHPLRALAPFGWADALTPFFAGAKLPSANASDQSIWPLASSSARNARQASSQTSCCSHNLSRRQQVEELGYCLGKSAQGAPVRRTQSIPSKTLRLSAQGLPPRLFFLTFGSNGSIFSHCSCVSFHRSLVIKNTPFYGQVYISSLLAQVYNLQILRL